MKIVRDGKEYELTREELERAYGEMGRIWDMDNVRTNFECYVDVDELSDEEYALLKDNEDFFGLAASYLRKYEDEGYSYDNSLQQAFDDAKKEFLEGYQSMDERLADAAQVCAEVSKDGKEDNEVDNGREF